MSKSFYYQYLSIARVLLIVQLLTSPEHTSILIIFIIIMFLDLFLIAVHEFPEGRTWAQRYLYPSIVSNTIAECLNSQTLESVTWTQSNPALLLLAVWTNFSEPTFFSVNRNNSNYLMGYLWGLNDNICARKIWHIVSISNVDYYSMGSTNDCQKNYKEL